MTSQSLAEGVGMWESVPRVKFKYSASHQARLEAIALRLKAIATRLELEAMATRLEAIACRLPSRSRASPGASPGAPGPRRVGGGGPQRSTEAAPGASQGTRGVVAAGAAHPDAWRVFCVCFSLVDFSETQEEVNNPQTIIYYTYI